MLTPWYFPTDCVAEHVDPLRGSVTEQTDPLGDACNGACWPPGSWKKPVGFRLIWRYVLPSINWITHGRKSKTHESDQTVIEAAQPGDARQAHRPHAWYQLQHGERLPTEGFRRHQAHGRLYRVRYTKYYYLKMSILLILSATLKKAMWITIIYNFGVLLGIRVEFGFIKTFCKFV